MGNLNNNIQEVLSLQISALCPTRQKLDALQPVSAATAMHKTSIVYRPFVLFMQLCMNKATVHEIYGEICLNFTAVSASGRETESDSSHDGTTATV